MSSDGIVGVLVTDAHLKKLLRAPEKAREATLKERNEVIDNLCVYIARNAPAVDEDGSRAAHRRSNGCIYDVSEHGRAVVQYCDYCPVNMLGPLPVCIREQRFSK